MSFDKEEVRQHATGQWNVIASQAFGISDDFLTTKHGSCPKCGGGPSANRWRVFDDFPKTGGAICNQCGKNIGDGFALGQWFLGISFDESIAKVAEFLKLEEPRRKGPARKGKPSKGADDFGLEFITWRDRLFDVWAATKSPITADAVINAGGKFAKFHGMTVIAIPFTGRDGSTNGYALYNATGGTIPYRPDRDSEIQQLKVRNVGCKQESGWAGRFLPGVETIKSEGVTDMLAILSCEPGASVICNPFGAGENPRGKFNSWMLERLRDETVYVIHDCDKPGQEGATFTAGERSRPGWAPCIASIAKECRNIVLPYEITESHGRDARDFLNDQIAGGKSPGEAYQELISLARSSAAVEGEAAGEEEDLENIEPISTPDDPHRLARMNLNKYEELCGGKVDGRFRLGYWRSEWWKWKQNRWVHVPASDLRNELTESIKDEFDRIWREEYKEWKSLDDKDGKREPTVRAVKTQLLLNVINAMGSEARINSNVDLHTWIDKRSEGRYIAMRNGIFDIQSYLEDKDEVIIEHSPNWFSTTCLDYEFDVDADCPRWKEYIKFTMEEDEERIKILQEFMGYLLYPSTEFQKFLALEGRGGNGKSVFFAAIEAVIGRDNISNVPLQRFHGQFDLFQTLGKMVNVCSDVAELDSVAEGVLKEYTGGDSMSFDRKNKDPVTARPTAKLIMSWNNRPTFRDRSDAIWRRMILIPFNRQIPETMRNSEMVNPAWWIKSGEVPGILNWCLDGLSRLVENDKFTSSERSTAAIESYKDESNIVRRFLMDIIVAEPQENVLAKDLYKEYVEYCAINGYKNPRNHSTFGSEVLKMFPGTEHRRKQVGGYRDYYYVGIRRKLNEDYEREEREADSIRKIRESKNSTS
jgi:P4 family phage/plasmid primase-like protien